MANNKITLATLSLATPQQVLDQISCGLVRQNAQSSNEKGECFYHSPNGLKCAAGMVMSKNEAKTIRNDEWTAVVADSSVPARHCELIQSLQTIHDDLDPPHWPQAIRSIASKLGLSTAAMDQAIKERSGD